MSEVHGTGGNRSIVEDSTPTPIRDSGWKKTEGSIAPPIKDVFPAPKIEGDDPDKTRGVKS